MVSLKTNHSSSTLIFELAVSTFNSSQLSIEEDIFELKASIDYVHLGGDYFD